MDITKEEYTKSNSFDVRQTVFYAYTCKFSLVSYVEIVAVCLDKISFGPLQKSHYPLFLWLAWIVDLYQEQIFQTE